jgi:Fe2+ transport system protein FeoA
MQLSGKKDSPAGARISLVDLGLGQDCILENLELPEDVAHRLMILGFTPGAKVSFSRSAPGGDPRVFQVEGAEVALRRETARQIRIRVASAPEKA